VQNSPIFVFGTGRSGTTIFHNLLSEHPNLAWTSHLCNYFPNHLELNRALMHCVDINILNKIIRKYIKPVEVYRFWDNYFRGFKLPYRDLKAYDVTPKIKRDLIKANTLLTTKKRYRLLHKITGHPRIEFLNEIFEDAKFIHIIRDGRAVANSMLNVDFWDGWMGPNKWLYGSLPKEYYNIWQKHNESFVALAALTWIWLMDEAKVAIDSIGRAKVLEIKYEDFCNNIDSSMRRICDFCDLEYSKEFEIALSSYIIRNNNDKYKRDLSTTQIDMMEEIMSKKLKEYGYL